MGFEGWCRDTFGGTGKTWKALAVTALIITLAAATSRAGDISGQPAGSLSVTNSVAGVTNSVTSVLPQVPGAAALYSLQRPLHRPQRPHRPLKSRGSAACTFQATAPRRSGCGRIRRHWLLIRRAATTWQSRARYCRLTRIIG
jgi:hypothetical protein